MFIILRPLSYVICLHFFSPDSLQRLHREVRLLKKCKHKNIVKFLALNPKTIDYKNAVEPQITILVLELLKGGDVKSKLVPKQKKNPTQFKEPFDEWYTRWLIKQVLEAVEHMHKNGFMHRDLKQDNLVFSDDTRTTIKVR